MPTITEIKAYAVGARFLFPDVQTILDIGGQDAKAISLNESGRVVKFEMNDRCAAGTGKFLEIMAQTLGYGRTVGVPVFEYLDSIGFTRREGDRRMLKADEG